MNDDQLLRYSRQIMLPQIDVAGQERLKNSKVLIVGLGGLGSPTSIYLAAAGIGELTLIDFDKVSLSNLQRQILYNNNDIGRLKINAARDHLISLNPEVDIRSFDEKLNEDDLIKEAKRTDVMIDATDNFATRFALNRVSVKTNTPLISGAAIRFEGQIAVFNPLKKISPCYRCLYDDEISIEESCSANGVFAPLLGIVGSMQACETIKVILDAGKTIHGKLLLIDALNMEIREAKLIKDNNCPICT